MISEKQLFGLAIKFHPIIVGWLIKNKKVKKSAEKLIVTECSNNTKCEGKSYPTRIISKVVETYNDGVKRIVDDYAQYYGKYHHFIQIALTNGDYASLVNFGINVYDIGNRSERYILAAQLHELFENFSEIIIDFLLPKDFPRIKGEDRYHYIKILQNQVNHLEKRNFVLNEYYYFNNRYIGRNSGLGSIHPGVKSNIKKYGIFAYAPMYKELEWDWDIVEKFKDHLVWRLLINDSNLIWDEEKLTKYYNYIPFTSPDNSTYFGKFNDDRTVQYSKFGHLSNDFLEKHKYDLDWRKLFSCGKFTWNGEDLKHFCKFAMSIDMPWSEPFRTTPASSQLNMIKLLTNEFFEWNPDNLLAFLQFDDKYWEKIKDIKSLHKCFLQIPNIKEIAEPHIKSKFFWNAVCSEHNFPYDELSEEFTIENIRKNKDEWSKPIRNVFLTMTRTPDTNYKYYEVITKWDTFARHENIPLTYQLASYLYKLDIVIGGGYVESDGGYMESDKRFPSVNGLCLFSSHHISTEEDITKILQDNDMLEILLSQENLNLDILKYITKNLFIDYSVTDYIDIINGLKNWDLIAEF